MAALLSTVVMAITVLIDRRVVKLHARNAPAVALKISGTPDQISARRGNLPTAFYVAAVIRRATSPAAPTSVMICLCRLAPSSLQSHSGRAGVAVGWSDATFCGRFAMVSIAIVARLIVMSPPIREAERRRHKGRHRLSPPSTCRPRDGTPDPPDHLNPWVLRLMLDDRHASDRQTDIARNLTAPSEAPTPRYGEYILSLLHGIAQCHEQEFNGGVPGQLEPVTPTSIWSRIWEFEELCRHHAQRRRS